MPLSDEDYRELIEHLNAELAGAGLSAVTEESLSNALFKVGPNATAKELVAAYVESVAEALSRRSQHTYRSALELAQEYISTETGEPITDFRLLVAPRDETLLRARQISLSEAPDVSALVSELRRVAASIREEQ